MILDFNKLVNGSFLSLPAHGRVRARATFLLAAHFAKRNTKFGGDGKARAGKNSFPPTLFLFARPNKNYQNSASEFSRKKVRIWYNIGSQIVCLAFVVLPLRDSASALWTLNPDFTRICHAERGSKNNFCSRKIRFEPIFFRKSFFSKRFSCKAIISACLLSKMNFLAGSSQ